jgi:signal transduction histidine kinase
MSLSGQEKRLEPYLEVMIFRALQEILGNAIRHNQDQVGKMQINVQLVIDENQIKLVVIDNGKGFDITILDTTKGLGLKLIQDRVEMLGGFFDIDSSPGQGCRVSFTVPILSFDKE